MGHTPTHSATPPLTGAAYNEWMAQREQPWDAMEYYGGLVPPQIAALGDVIPGFDVTQWLSERQGVGPEGSPVRWATDQLLRGATGLSHLSSLIPGLGNLYQTPEIAHWATTVPYDTQMPALNEGAPDPGAAIRGYVPGPDVLPERYPSGQGAQMVDLGPTPEAQAQATQASEQYWQDLLATLDTTAPAPSGAPGAAAPAMNPMMQTILDMMADTAGPPVGKPSAAPVPTAAPAPSGPALADLIKAETDAIDQMVFQGTIGIDAAERAYGQALDKYITGFTSPSGQFVPGFVPTQQSTLDEYVAGAEQRGTDRGVRLQAMREGLIADGVNPALIESDIEFINALYSGTEETEENYLSAMRDIGLMAESELRGRGATMFAGQRGQQTQAANAMERAIRQMGRQAEVLGPEFGFTPGKYFTGTMADLDMAGIGQQRAGAAAEQQRFDTEQERLRVEAEATAGRAAESQQIDLLRLLSGMQEGELDRASREGIAAAGERPDPNWDIIAAYLGAGPEGVPGFAMPDVWEQLYNAGIFADEAAPAAGLSMSDLATQQRMGMEGLTGSYYKVQQAVLGGWLTQEQGTQLILEASEAAGGPLAEESTMAQEITSRLITAGVPLNQLMG